jgi:hypothetical protein
MHIVKLLVFASISAVFADAAIAQKLPKNATPLTNEEVIALYSGNTAVWKGSRAYFAPDNKVKGIFGEKAKRVTYSGEWSAADNEVCMKNRPKGDPALYTDCWKWWRSGKKLLTLWSVHYDGSKADEKNGYYDKEAKALKKGDLLTKEYEELGGE